MITNPTTIEEIVANRETWAEALESGGYKQAIGSLQEDDRYCCLGVLCDISGIGEWVERRYQVENESGLDYPPSDVFALVRITWPQGEKLVDANDNLGKGFSEIADMIRNLPITNQVSE